MLRKVHFEDLVEFAKAYKKLGGQVQEQLDDLVAGDGEGLNPAAVDTIKRELKKFHPQVEKMVERWYDEDEDDEDED